MGVTITDHTDSRAFAFWNFDFLDRTAIADQLPTPFLTPPGPVHNTKGTFHSADSMERGRQKGGMIKALLVL